MKYTFVVAFALALAGHADASPVADKRQTDQEIADWLSSGRANNGLLINPILPREEKRQFGGYTAEELAVHAGTAVFPPPVPPTQQKREVDANSKREFPITPEMAQWATLAGSSGPVIPQEFQNEKAKRQPQSITFDQLAGLYPALPPSTPGDIMRDNSKRVPPPDVLEQMGGSYYGQNAKRVPPPEMLDEIAAPELNDAFAERRQTASNADLLNKVSAPQLKDAFVEKRQAPGVGRVARSFKA